MIWSVLEPFMSVVTRKPSKTQMIHKRHETETSVEYEKQTSKS